jgi:hypothetical protein
VGALPLVKRADAGGAGLESRAGRGRETGERGGAVEVAQDEGVGASPVEALGVVEDGGVALGPDAREDGADVGLDAREVRLTAGAQAVEGALGLWRAIDEAREHRNHRDPV